MPSHPKFRNLLDRLITRKKEKGNLSSNGWVGTLLLQKVRRSKRIKWTAEISTKKDRGNSGAQSLI